MNHTQQVEEITGEKIRDSLSFIDKLNGKEIVELENAIDDAITTLISDTERLEREKVIGNIGAKLLARHTPQNILDAYFDVANEELE